MRDRKYTVGSELRAELKKPRNAGFHRLAHAIGGMVVANLDDFADLDHHAAVKRLQRECGVCCDEIELDLGPVGKVVAKQPRSIAFDEMEEAEFQELVQAIYNHIAKKYWPDMSPESVEEMVLAFEGHS